MEPTRISSPSSASRSAMRSRPIRGAWVLAAASLALTSACGDNGTQQTTSASPLPVTGLLNVYAALGDALTAGMVSNALVETHQAYSFPAQIGRVGGTQSFQQPRVSRPGIDVEAELRRFYPGPFVIEPSASTPGLPLNASLGGPFNNLGVPGATARDLVATSGSAGGFHALVLRNLGTALAQCGRLQPSLVTLWIGNSDVLKAVIGGRAIDGTTLTRPADFEQDFEQAVTTLQKSTSAVIVVANIPDFTKSPFVTAIKPYIVDPATGEPKLKNGQPIALIGPTGTPLPSSSRVTLAASSLLAQGIGIPVSEGGLGTPLRDEVVLDETEVDIIRERVDTFNRSIAEVSATAGLSVVDMHAVFDELASSGRNVGGTVLTSTFLTGGVFSYDGVHPSDLGYALLANEWIKVINEEGGALPLIDLSPIMSARADAPLGAAPPITSFVFSKEALDSLKRIYGCDSAN